MFGKLVQLDQLTSVARSYACTALVTVCDTSVQDSNLVVGGTTNTYFSTKACYSTYGCGGCDGWCGDEGGAGIDSVWWYIFNSNIADFTTLPSNYWAGLQGKSDPPDMSEYAGFIQPPVCRARTRPFKNSNNYIDIGGI